MHTKWLNNDKFFFSDPQRNLASIDSNLRSLVINLCNDQSSGFWELYAKTTTLLVAVLQYPHAQLQNNTRPKKEGIEMMDAGN